MRVCCQSFFFFYFERMKYGSPINVFLLLLPACCPLFPPNHWAVPLAPAQVPAYKTYFARALIMCICKSVWKLKFHFSFPLFGEYSWVYWRERESYNVMETVKLQWHFRVYTAQWSYFRVPTKMLKICSVSSPWTVSSIWKKANTRSNISKRNQLKHSFKRKYSGSFSSKEEMCSIHTIQ